MEKTKISLSSWKTALRQWLKRQQTDSRIAIIGIGNTFRSDDAAGIMAARSLLGSQLLRGLTDILIMDAGQAPENFTVELRRFAPDLILLIDAADMNEPVGAIRLIDMEEIDGMSASTHSLPLSMLASYLMLELNCDIKLLGIQAGSNDVGEIRSPQILHAVDEVVHEIENVLSAKGPVY